jgi:RNA polymerase sigma-70 factor (ECF subfamily)
VSLGDKADAASDEELVRRARDGDQTAMNRLVDRHHGAAFRVALSLVADPDLAQDVAQDAFLRAFRGLEGFRGDASFRTWMLTIAANTAKGALRKMMRRRETALDGVAPVASPEASPEDRAAIEEEAAKARAMLAKLPEKQRMSVQLRVDEGLSFREIGEVIGSSEGAARVNYFHGIRRLREWME